MKLLKTIDNIDKNVRKSVNGKTENNGVKNDFTDRVIEKKKTCDWNFQYLGTLGAIVIGYNCLCLTFSHRLIQKKYHLSG